MNEDMRPLFSLEPSDDGFVILQLRDNTSRVSDQKMTLKLTPIDARILGLGLVSVAESCATANGHDSGQKTG